MISRGHFIGQIIDEFAGISSQVRARANLHFFDINTYLENFCRDVLNIVMDLNLVNLNDEKVNAKGLDLGDKKAKTAFQITSTSNITKVHDTLTKSVSYLPTYKKIYILMLDKRQATYGLDAALTAPFNFTEKNILDFDELTRMAITMPLDRLQQLSELISKEIVRVRMELEIPDADGKFQNDISQYIESIPKATYTGVKNYFRFHEKEFDSVELTEEEVDQDFKALQLTLKKLPRMTRQLFVVMLERSDYIKGGIHISADYLKRISSLPDLDGDLRLLDDANLVILQSYGDHETIPTWELYLGSNKNDDSFLLNIISYVEAKKTTFEKFVTRLDFSDFGDGQGADTSSD